MEKIPEMPSIDKEKLWLEEKEIVDKITDGLGLGIDEGIKDAIIALHLLGINTTCSHEGKIDRYPVPYIDIEQAYNEKLEKELAAMVNELLTPEDKQIREEIQNLYKELNLIDDWESAEAVIFHNKIKILSEKLNKVEFKPTEKMLSIRSTLEAENLKEREKILNLLNQFYEGRMVSEESKLAIYPMATWSRLQSQGWETQENETNDDARIKRLQEFQKEMNSFTEFMKKKVFEES